MTKSIDGRKIMTKRVVEFEMWTETRVSLHRVLE